MMWDGFDKRKFPRLNFACSVTIHIPSKDPIKGTAENIGAGGLCIILKEDLARFTECRIELRLSDKLPVVKTRARVAWNVCTQKPNLKGKVYDTGIEFLDIDPALQAMIQTFVEHQLSKKD